MVVVLFEQPQGQEVGEQRANRSALPAAEGNPVQNDRAENPSMTRIPLSLLNKNNNQPGDEDQASPDGFLCYFL